MAIGLLTSRPWCTHRPTLKCTNIFRRLTSSSDDPPNDEAALVGGLSVCRTRCRPHLMGRQWPLALIVDLMRHACEMHIEGIVAKQTTRHIAPAGKKAA